MTDTAHRDPMQEFANRIIAELENGVKPWLDTPEDDSTLAAPNAVHFPHEHPNPE